jgi:hypothetical protein
MILIKFALDQPRLRSDILRLHLTMCQDSERLTDLKESNFKRLSERSEERFVLFICGDIEQTGHTSIQEVFDVVPYLREVKKERERETETERDRETERWFSPDQLSISCVCIGNLLGECGPHDRLVQH